MWMVLIEWDGKQPPTTYYSSLHNLCLKVRGDKEYAPIIRRAGEYNKAVIVQEGAVLVPSESLARQIAYLASHEGARSVMVGNVELSDDGTRTLTDSEREVIQRFNDTFKKRGRPSANDMEEKDWVITCPECVKTSIITARKVIQCPMCGGLRVSARAGTRDRFMKPTSASEWLYSRFSTGSFEIPAYSSQGNNPRSSIIDNITDEDIANKVIRSTWATKDPIQLDIMDMVFCARRYYTYKDRQRSRVSCCLRMYELGFSQSDISLFEQSNIFEPIDAAMFFVGNYDDLINTFYKKGGF